MDIEAILRHISVNLNRPVDELRNSNIDEVFQIEPDDEIGCISPIYLLVDYIEKHLPLGYSIEVVSEPHKHFAPVNVYLEKTLVKEKITLEGNPLVEYKNYLKVELALLDANDGFANETDFSKIGDILNKVKLAYEQIEKVMKQMRGLPPDISPC